MSVIPFPIRTAADRPMPSLTSIELRQRARDNFYAAERRLGVDPSTAFDRAEAFAAEIDRIWTRIAGEIMRQT